MKKTILFKSVYLALTTALVSFGLNRLYGSLTGYIMGLESYGETYFSYRGFGWIEITQIPEVLDEETYLNLTHTFQFDPVSLLITMLFLGIIFYLGLKKYEKNKEYYKSL